MLVLSRSRGRPRCPLALALLAWLMLATMPPAAWSRMAAAAPAMVHAPHGPMHAGPAGCCDGHGTQPDRHATHTCNCALPCTGVLPCIDATPGAMSPATARYAPPRPIEAPLTGYAPPLRPPLA